MKLLSQHHVEIASQLLLQLKERFFNGEKASIPLIFLLLNIFPLLRQFIQKNSLLLMSLRRKVIFKNLVIKMLINKFNQVKFVKVTCGYTHQVALDQFGRIFSWGDATDGALGHLNSKEGKMKSKERKVKLIFLDFLTPQIVNSLSRLRVLDVGCGEHFTVVITVNRSSRIESEYSKKFKNTMIKEAKKNVNIIQEYSKNKLKLMDLMSPVSSSRANDQRASSQLSESIHSDRSDDQQEKG